MKSADTRDMFAAAAMAALIEKSDTGAVKLTREEIAWEAYAQATEMMDVRGLLGRGAEQEIDAQRQMGVSI